MGATRGDYVWVLSGRIVGIMFATLMIHEAVTSQQIVHRGCGVVCLVLVWLSDGFPVPRFGRFRHRFENGYVANSLRVSEPVLRTPLHRIGPFMQVGLD